MPPSETKSVTHPHLHSATEVFFYGGHTDIGGSFIQQDTADIALAWIMSSLQECLPDLIPYDEVHTDFWDSLRYDHAFPYGTKPPYRFKAKLSQGFQAICALRPQIRNVTPSAFLHPSVPSEISRQYSDSISLPLNEIEVELKLNWQLENEKLHQARVLSKDYMKVFKWAKRVELNLRKATQKFDQEASLMAQTTLEFWKKMSEAQRRYRQLKA